MSVSQAVYGQLKEHDENGHEDEGVDDGLDLVVDYDVRHVPREEGDERGQVGDEHE